MAVTAPARPAPPWQEDAPGAASPPRSIAIDAAKGLAIILVVYGHCVRGLVTAGAVPSGTWLQWIDYAVYTFHMPLFFVVSGLLFRPSFCRGSGTFWRRRLMTIAYPYFLWSLVQGLAQLLLAGSGTVNHPPDPARLVEILWAPISPFWFLYALFFCNVLAGATLRLRADVVAALALAAFLAAFWLAPGTPADIAYGFFYFSIGMLAGERGWLKALPRRWGAVALLTGVFLTTAAASFALGIPERLPLAAAVLGVGATLALCGALERGRVIAVLARPLAVAGRYSMGIFVMHILVLGLVRAMLLKGLHVDEAAVLIPAATTAAILVPIAIQALAVRLRLNDLAGLPYSAGKDRPPRPAGV